MLRAAAKNYKNVIPLCDYSLYQNFMDSFSNNNGIVDSPSIDFPH